MSEQPTNKKRMDSRLKLILLQSGICVAVVLLALLLRFAGGGVFDELKQSFRAAVEDDRLLRELGQGTTTVSTTTTATLPTVTTSSPAVSGTKVPGTTADD